MPDKENEDELMESLISRGMERKILDKIRERHEDRIVLTRGEISWLIDWVTEESKHGFRTDLEDVIYTVNPNDIVCGKSAKEWANQLRGHHEN
jgi:poly(3-hydroxyalkanoate) synthetase